MGPRPEGVWPKVFRHDDGQSVTVLLVDRRPAKDPFLLKLDPARLNVSGIRKGVLYTLDGKEVELKLIAEAGGALEIDVPARDADPAAIILRP